jgi:hypothetical protein
LSAVKEWLQTYSVKVYSLRTSWRLQFFKYFLDNCKFRCILEISSIQILNFTTLNLQCNSSLNLKSSYKKSVISNFLLKIVSNFKMYSFGSRSNLFCQAQNERQNVLYRKWSHQYVGIEFLIDKNNLKKKVMSVWFLICIVKFVCSCPEYIPLEQSIDNKTHTYINNSRNLSLLQKRKGYYSMDNMEERQVE